MQGIYDLVIKSGEGQYLTTVTRAQTLQYSLREREVGLLSFEVNLDRYNRDFFTRHNNRVEIWRQVPNGLRYLELNTAWLIQGWREPIIGRGKMLTVTAQDGTRFLSSRIAAYFSGAVQVEVDGFAANLIRQAAIDNFGSTASTPPGGTIKRVWTDYIDFEAATGFGATVEKAFAWRNLLDVVREIAQSSWTDGIYITFQIVYIPARDKWEVRIYEGQLGADRRDGTSSPLILDTEEQGLFLSGEYYTDHANSITWAYGAGQGREDDRLVVMGYNNTVLQENPFARTEGKIDLRNTADKDKMKQEIRAYLAENAPKIGFTGKLNPQHARIQYGRDLFYGDLMTVRTMGKPDIHPRLSAISVSLSNNKEDIDIALDGEAVIDYEYIVLDYNPSLTPPVIEFDCGLHPSPVFYPAWDSNAVYSTIYIPSVGTYKGYLSSNSFVAEPFGAGSSTFAIPLTTGYITNSVLTFTYGATQSGLNYWTIFFSGSGTTTTVANPATYTNTADYFPATGDFIEAIPTGSPGTLTITAVVTYQKYYGCEFTPDD